MITLQKPPTTKPIGDRILHAQRVNQNDLYGAYTMQLVELQRTYEGATGAKLDEYVAAAARLRAQCDHELALLRAGKYQPPRIAQTMPQERVQSLDMLGFLMLMAALTWQAVIKRTLRRRL